MRHGHLGIAMAVGAAALLAGAPVAASDEPQEPRRDPEPDPERDTPVAERGAIPDRVSLEKGSPYYFPHWQKLGVRYNGAELSTVVEFCVSEGWIRKQIFHGGRPKTERGRFITAKLHGTIEPHWRSQP